MFFLSRVFYIQNIDYISKVTKNKKTIMHTGRLFDILELYRKRRNRKKVLAVKKGDKWVYHRSSDYIEKANHVSSALLSMGIMKGETAATVFSSGMPEFNFLDMGMAQLGVIHVPVYPKLSTRELEYIFTDSGIKIIFISDHAVLNHVKPVLNSVTSSIMVIMIEPVEGFMSFDKFMETGRKSHHSHLKDIESLKKQIEPNHLATIIYTSGTTGLPKGVMLTHENLISNAYSGYEMLPLGEKHKVLSILPLSHIYERTTNYLWQIAGVTIYYAESLTKAGTNLKEIRPHGFVTVPRLLEKLFFRILNEGKKLGGYRRNIFFWAVRLASLYNNNHQNSLSFKTKQKLASVLVYRKWRGALGGRVKFIGCGGAALQPSLEKIFWTAGIPVYQGYGLTETSPLISLNRITHRYRRIGTVGPPIKNVEVKINGDGEILTRGPNLMLGYYKNPVLTSRSIDNDGWFYTGDIGKLSTDNFLEITGRKKELFKNSYGKYIAPYVIESKLRESHYIDQVMVVGEGEKFAAALICPDFNHLWEWYTSLHEDRRITKKQLIQLPGVLELFHQEIDYYNTFFSDTEKIKKFELIHDKWKTISGELTPSIKLKRESITRKYNDKIRAIYGKKEFF